MMNLLPKDGEAFYVPAFFTPEESRFYFEALKDKTPWRQEPVTIFGKKIMQPRLTAWYGDPGTSYTYSGTTMDPLPWNEELVKIRDKVNTFTQANFTNVLLNHYRDGQDSMGWHRDDEKVLGPNPIIASVTFGQPRSFKLRHRQDRNLVEVLLESGSLFLMRGPTQHHWEHSVPKTTKPLQARINLTFRILIK